MGTAVFVRDFPLVLGMFYIRYLPGFAPLSFGESLDRMEPGRECYLQMGHEARSWFLSYDSS